jgi:hypothetical protein
MANPKKKWVVAPPTSYLARARSFAEAARILNAQQKNDFTPYLLCCGQATEVALKGLLLLAGASESTFSKDPGHGLVRAWRSAAMRGAPLAADPPQWCELLDVVHTKPFDSRYPRANVLMGLPAADVMLNGIDQLIAILQVKLDV